MHAGKNVLGSVAANCVAQDETALLSVPISGMMTLLTNDDDVDHAAAANSEGGAEKEMSRLPDHACNIKTCKVCSATIAYIGGFFCFSLQKTVRCATCLSSLFHAETDVCPERSLILMKNYFADNRGLKYPSGSLCDLLFHAEKIIRSSQDSTHHKKALDILLHRALLSLDRDTFLDLQLSHSLDTADGTENHYTSLVHLILKKYISLRLKKIFKDKEMARNAKGHYLHRSRIFQNV